MFGISGKIMLAMGAVILVVAAIAYFLWQDNNALREDIGELKTAVKVQEDTINAITTSVKENQKGREELNEKITKIEKNTGRLIKIFADHDLHNLGKEKPGLIENRINDAVRELNRSLEELSNPESYDVE